MCIDTHCYVETLTFITQILLDIKSKYINSNFNKMSFYLMILWGEEGDQLRSIKLLSRSYGFNIPLQNIPSNSYRIYTRHQIVVFENVSLGSGI